jgi:hypothetical protein
MMNGKRSPRVLPIRLLVELCFTYPAVADINRVAEQ